MKYHYVYRITNKVCRKHYYGVRSSNNHPKQDIGIQYFSSSYDKDFIKDQKENPANFKYKIIFICKTRHDCLQIEIKLHSKFNVSSNTSFYNKAKQLSNGFDCSGILLTEEHKKKIGLRHLGKFVSNETKERISANHADVSGTNNPMYGNPSAMRGKVSVQVIGTDIRQVIETTEYHKHREKYVLTSNLRPKKPFKIVACPHCGKQGKGSNMSRYHFNNCKEVKNDT